MFLPTSLLVAPTVDGETFYTVSLFHHPYNWMTPSFKRTFSEYIESNSDLVMTGHEHVEAYYKKETFVGESTDYIEGCVFQEHGGSACGFNMVVIDLAKSQEQVFKAKWKDDYFSVEEVTSGWRHFRRSRPKREFEITDAMISFLHDPGARYSHPAKADLRLDDIFVPPNLQKLTFKSGSENFKQDIIQSRDVIASISLLTRTMVLGKEGSGKSTLAKIFFWNSYQKGQAPVLIQGHEIKSPDIEKFNRLVKRQVELDYKNPVFDKLIQIDGAVDIIIDDFDDSKLNPKGRLKLLEAISSKYNRVTVFGDDILCLEELSSGEAGVKNLENFTHFQILEYGHVLRSAMIDKWYGINAEYSADPADTARKVALAERMIDDVLGRSYLPSHPFFILTLLQGLQLGQRIDGNSASYAYLYNVLITSQLAQSDKGLALDKKLVYLAEFAYNLWKTKSREVSQEGFEAFHSLHCVKYVPVERSVIVKALIDSGIIELRYEQYRFKYPYFFYYFLADFLGRHLESEEARDVVRYLCANIHDEENSNILLFITHQSRSTFVLDTILSSAAALFQSTPPLQLEADVAFLSALYKRVPQLVYVDKSPEEMRAERRTRMDETPPLEEEGSDQSEAKNEQAKAAEEMVNNVKAGVRTLEVMGQIVKNYAGSMTFEPRLKLVSECYMLGLRLLGSLFDTWQTMGAGFIDSVLGIILDKEEIIESKAELEKLLKEIIFYFCENAAFGIIRHVSRCVGSPDLREIYQLVLKINTTNSYRMIDLSVRLDSLGLPVDKIVDLNLHFKNDIFCSMLLRRLVLNHFYLFNVAEPLKQKICDTLEIKRKKIHEIDVASAQRKMLPNKG